jgi:hypothetical protein
MKIKTTLSALALFALAACSNSPTESDAKKIVENELGGCRFLSLENFQKINGIVNNNGSHSMEIKYSIKVKAFPEVAKMATDYSSKFDAIRVRSEKAKEANANVRKEMLERSQKLQNGIKDRGEWNAFKAETDKFENEVAIPASQQVSLIHKELNQAIAESEAIAKRFAQECPNMDNRLRLSIYENNQGIDTYTKDYTRAAHENLMMVKSDNGWVRAN